MTRSRSVLVSLAVLAWSAGAQAQPLDRDADADRLFKEGQKLMEERRFAEACPKLESAYKKDQQLGTLLNLAYCHKEMGSTWLSWVEFREAESKAVELKRTDRRDFAREKMRELEKSLSKVVVDPKAGVELAQVDVEDRRVYEAEKGVPFAVEPNGQRKFVFHARGKKPGVLLVNVPPLAKDGKVQHVTIPELVNDDLGSSASVTTDTPPPPQGGEPARGEKSSWSGQKTLAVVAGVLGLGGVAVGSVFGVKTVTGPCSDGPRSEGGGFCGDEDLARTNREAMISNIGFIAGGVLVAGAVVLWITAPSSSGRSAQVTVGPSWAGLGGTF
ncbi:MAG: hypothetical protein KIT84_25165 [Labilithrix sp.]|nr:hypothetical protein [Labilithrix sp.]MCW5814342.1 hypothetical protein [Labilithrix sp.]